MPRRTNTSPSPCSGISIATCGANLRGPAVWPDIDDADPPEADLVNTAEGQAFQNCMPSQTFSGFIDYIILGRQMAQGLVPGFVRT